MDWNRNPKLAGIYNGFASFFDLITDGISKTSIFILLVLSIIIINIILVEYDITHVNDYLPDTVSEIMIVGGNFLLIILSMLVGIILFRRGSAKGSLSKFFTGGNNLFSKHPFYFTGSSEYNDKIITDNYLPSL